MLAADQSFSINGTFSIPLPKPSDVQASAVLVAEATGDNPGANTHAELRKQLMSPAGSDSLPGSIPDPPTLTISPSPSPSPTPTTLPITVSAPLPGGFSSSSTFTHVHIHSADGHFHWHFVGPANTPITIPAGVLPAGSYTVDFSYAQDLSLSDGTVAATLADDYTKLTRPPPLRLSRSSFSLTVN
jgi:hypothetical protein